MNIRYGNEHDSSLLAELGRKTFSDTFTHDNAPENMAIYLSEHYAPEIQLSELRDPDTIFFIAEMDHVPIGYAKLKGQSTGAGVTGTNPMELQRIYTLQTYIGKGIGAELMKECIKEAKQRGFDCLWLGVWEKNERAIRFYEKWGFKKVGHHVFMLGKDIQKDFTMELRFTA